MGRTAKVAVTVEEELLERAEELRRRTGESRSAVFTRALRRLLGAEEHDRKVQRYLEAYRESPEGDDEVAAARRSARRAMSTVTWEEE